ncbi:amphiregulin isoform X2 [Pseudophryne corroboree]
MNVTVSAEERISAVQEKIPDLGHEGDNEDDVTIREFIIDDSIRVQPVIKPEKREITATTAKKAQKKKADKKKKNAQNKRKKKKNLCQTTHANFCVHGECKYLAGLHEVACKCHQHYFGERCIERSMKSESGAEISDITTTTALAVVAVLLSVISIAAIIIIIIVHTRRKYSSYECEAEEKKKLGQENGSEDIDV